MSQSDTTEQRQPLQENMKPKRLNFFEVEKVWGRKATKIYLQMSKLFPEHVYISQTNKS